MLVIGDKAPSFVCKDQNGKEISLNDFSGKKVILYFYPKDSTPGCTVQACNLRDNYEMLQKEGYIVLGASIDSEKRHQNFIAKNDLPFTLLSDVDMTLVNQYGVWREKNNYGKTYMGIVRTTFVIDEEGTITDIIEKVKTKEHTNQIIKA
jgi:thioredoxin-dependent peroxiredoxin